MIYVFNLGSKGYSSNSVYIVNCSVLLWQFSSFLLSIYDYCSLSRREEPCAEIDALQDNWEVVLHLLSADFFIILLMWFILAFNGTIGVWTLLACLVFEFLLFIFKAYYRPLPFIFKFFMQKMPGSFWCLLVPILVCFLFVSYYNSGFRTIFLL